MTAATPFVKRNARVVDHLRVGAKHGNLQVGFGG